MLYLFALDESVNSFLNERKLLEETSSILNFRNNRLILIKKQKQKWYYCSLFKDMKLRAEFCFIKNQLLSSDPWFLLHTTNPTSIIHQFLFMCFRGNEITDILRYPDRLQLEIQKERNLRLLSAFGVGNLRSLVYNGYNPYVIREYLGWFL